MASCSVMEQWIVCVFQKICHNGCLETSHVMKHPIYIAIQLLVDWITYQLPVLVNKYLEFSMVNGFVSAIFIKTINCVGEPLDRHLNSKKLLLHPPSQPCLMLLHVFHHHLFLSASPSAPTWLMWSWVVLLLNCLFSSLDIVWALPSPY